MKADSWKRKIRQNCEDAGTYQSQYDSVIDTLAEILQKRDEAEKEYEKKGRQPVIEYTNKAGATNIIKNPLLIIITELNSQALAYWRDLGLTPAGLKKIKADAAKDRNTGNLEKLLSKMYE